MNEANDQQQPQQPLPPQPQTDQLEILKYLREEAEKNREAQRDESDANRKLFIDTSKIVAIPLAVALALAGLLFYRDLSTMKEAMKTEGEAEAKAEIKRMDAQIDKTLEDRFQSYNIQKTIQKAALDATSKQAPGLIREVITPEVRKAVEGQSGTIRTVASQAATEQVRVVLEPVVADVKLQGITARANSDDATAFDELLALRNAGKAASSPEKGLVAGVIENLERHAPEGTTLGSGYIECADPRGDEYKASLASPDPAARKKAIGDCLFYMSIGQWAPKLPGKPISAFTVMETIAPIWMKLAVNDPSLSVRAQTITGLNWLFRDGFKDATDVPPNGFDLLDTTSLKSWWVKHQPDQASIALFAYSLGSGNAFSADARLNEIGLYDEAERVAKASPPNRTLLLQLQNNMRSYAANPRLPAPDLQKEMMGRGCDGVQSDLAIRLNGFNKQPEQERVDGYALLELQYLAANCKVEGQALTQIAHYGVSTRSLSNRYAVVKIVNKSSGTSFDPYQTKKLEEWVQSH